MSNEAEKGHHDDRHVSPNARLGLSLFGVYLTLYLGFVAIAAFKYEWFNLAAPGGVNLAIAYGMGLILVALLLAAVYMMFCKPEK